MEIRSPRPDETELVKSLDSYCFDHDNRPDKTELFFKLAYQPENTLAVFYDDRLASCLQVIPYRVRIRDTWMNCGGISSVSTWPEYRGRSLVRKLMFHSLGLMRQKKQYISILGPFSYAYYRRMGWGLLYENMALEFSQSVLESFPSHDYSLRPLTADDVAGMRQVYEAHIRKYEAVFDRSIKEWLSKLEWDVLLGQKRYGVFNSQGEMEGYIHYHIGGKIFEIYELHYTNIPARQALLHFVYAHRSEADQVKWWSLPLDDVFTLEIDNPAIKRTIYTSMMGRISDVSGFFTSLKLDAALEGSVVITVEDSLAAWNKGTWSISVDQGQVSARKTDAPAQLSCDIAVLSQMALGWLSAGRAVQAGLLSVDFPAAVEIWDRLFPASLTWMNEHF